MFKNRLSNFFDWMKHWDQKKEKQENLIEDTNASVDRLLFSKNETKFRETNRPKKELPQDIIDKIHESKPDIDILRPIDKTKKTEVKSMINKTTNIEKTSIFKPIENKNQRESSPYLIYRSMETRIWHIEARLKSLDAIYLLLENDDSKKEIILKFIKNNRKKNNKLSIYKVISNITKEKGENNINNFPVSLLINSPEIFSDNEFDFIINKLMKKDLITLIDLEIIQLKQLRSDLKIEKAKLEWNKDVMETKEKLKIFEENKNLSKWVEEKDEKQVNIKRKDLIETRPIEDKLILPKKKKKSIKKVLSFFRRKKTHNSWEPSIIPESKYDDWEYITHSFITENKTSVFSRFLSKFF